MSITATVLKRIFWNEPRVLCYVSTHQWPYFPGTGSASEVGGSSAIDRTLNVPLPRGATGDTLRRAIEELASPVIEDFEPTWVLVSAGFDAHRADPLADFELTSGDFAAMAQLAASFAPRSGRVAMFLEGGYDLRALHDSVNASLAAVLGVPYESEPPSSGGPGLGELVQIRDDRRQAIESMYSLEPEREG